MRKNVKIIIIGAGVSGLSAAVHLHNRGFKNVTILEARERIGGRVFSLNYGKSYVEMGAQWIHGQIGNDIYTLAKENNLVDEDCTYYLSKAHEWHHLDVQEEKDAAGETVTFLNAVLDNYSPANIADQKISPECCSLGSALRKEFINHLAEGEYPENIKKVKEAAFDWFLRLQNEIFGCSTLDDVSLHDLQHYRECEGNNLTELKYGYSKVIDLLASRLPAEWINLNRIVSHIEWNESTNSNKNISVTVSCSDGQKIEADHVIVTLPLGCLKSSAEKMFTPSLPPKKLQAIKSLGFNAVNKIYLEYEEPFWESDAIFLPLWLDDMNYLGNSIRSDKILDENTWKLSHSLGKTWFRYIGRFAFVPRQPNVLSVWIAGEGSKYMETLPDDQVIRECNNVLCEILKRKDIPLPKKIVRTNWFQDPHSQGSYSYISTDCDITGSLPSDLADPLYSPSNKEYPVVMFAGEATHSNFFSTVHGAYSTGIREAQRLANFYRMTPRIIIVGAGAAGLAAAQKLIQTGFKNLLIVEAQDHVGGRIDTQNFDGNILELGAQWIHGEEGNPVYKFAAKRGLLSETVNIQSFEGCGQFCTSKGERLDPEFTKEVIMVLDTIKEELCDDTHFASWKQEDEDMSVEKVFRKKFDEYISQRDDYAQQKAVLKGIYDWYIRFETIDNGCPSLEDASIKTYSEYIECPGTPLINLKHGYFSIVEALLSDIPNTDTIVLKKPVKCIHWKNVCFPEEKDCDNGIGLPYRVALECADGQMLYAHHVVVTPSLGFLKDNEKTFFLPPLPKPVSLAIKHLGFGTINKIYLEYPTPFWKKTDLGFQLIWTDQKDKDNSYPAWVKSISGFDIVRSQPNMLVGWIGGNGAEQVETVPSDEVAQICTNILQQFLPAYKVPSPAKIIRSQWHSNPYIRGAYSYFSLGFEKTGLNVPTAFQPITEELVIKSGKAVQWPLLLFAGEATDQQFYSTVHGAIRSGWREAQRLLSFWSDNVDSSK